LEPRRIMKTYRAMGGGDYRSPSADSVDPDRETVLHVLRQREKELRIV
jgi:hypothetical protein